MAEAAHIAAGQNGLAVRRLSLTNFRNYQDFLLDLTDLVGAEGCCAPVVLFGLNGAGKTNLLEALSYLGVGRGLRGAKLSDLRRIEPGQKEDVSRDWVVSASVSGFGGIAQIGTTIGRGSGDADDYLDGPDLKGAPKSERRLVKLDGKIVNGQSALGSVLSMMWLTPKMDRIFAEGASPRRRFLDQIVMGIHPDHSRQLSRYERAMKDRMILLQNNNRDSAWLSALEKKIAEHGIAIAAARLDALSELQAQIASQAESAFPKARLEIDGFVEQALSEHPALKAEDIFRERLEAARHHDQVSGRTSLGPHRSDLLAYHLSRDMKAGLCSTGEQKALLIGILLANARLLKALRGEAPILLLDEIAAHLDAKRRRVLFDELLALGSQIWMTGTQHNLFSDLYERGIFLHVQEGTIDFMQNVTDLKSIKPRIVS